MMEHPEVESNCPSAPKERAAPQPREHNPNIMGSNSGAGSGEFHVFRHDKEREMKRISYMNYQERKQNNIADFEAKKQAAETETQTKTEKNSKKRLKKKQKKVANKKAVAEAAAAGKTTEGDDESRSSSGSESSSNEEGEDEPHFKIGGR